LSPVIKKFYQSKPVRSKTPSKAIAFLFETFDNIHIMNKYLEIISQKFNQWRDIVLAKVKNKPQLFTPVDVKDWDYLRDIGFPGEFPFVRGIQSSMYSGKLWTMRQYAGFGGAEETNQRFRYLLDKGQTGLSIAFDLPTQMGIDSDNPQAQGEVGRTGVAIDTIEDMTRLFHQIPIEKVSTSMTINATCMITLAMYLILARQKGIPWSTLRGTVQNDILKEYIARGCYIYPPEPSMRLVGDVFEFCRKEMPLWNVISVSGYHMREAGCSALQEVAFTLANAIEYTQYALSRGLEIDDFAKRISFFFNVHNNFIEEIAKFRAARRLWAKIIRERFKAKNPKAMMLRFHCQTAGSTLTAQQPLNNAIRVAFQALAAVLGGAQSIHTNSYDEALALPSDLSSLLALRTQQIIAYETGIPEIIDPLGGSYTIETYTNNIEEQASLYIKKIDKMGGMIPAIMKGFVNQEIEENAYQYQLEIEEKKKIIVGMNEFKTEKEPQIQIQKINPKLEEQQIKRLKEFKRKRNFKEVKTKLASLKEAAKRKDNLMPYVIEAVNASCTLGEISDTLKEIFGSWEGKKEII
jgi:methylmalonyl-CoA mutase N-terminal domain/subunit